MKVALFKTVGKYSSEMIWPESMGDSLPGYVRLSEFVDVAFPPLPQDIQNAEEITQLDAAATKIRTEMGAKLHAIEARKAGLLCITDQREVVA